MNPTASPFDDAARVQLLHELRLLDATGESGWQALARLASAHTGCSMGALSLVDSQRQWFAASHGFTASETPREHAFCSHAILSSDVMVVPDASVDPRFSANLLVADGRVRMYAAAPVVLDGHRIGTVCCLDEQPRVPDAEALGGLRDLAELAGSLLQMRLAARAHRQAESILRDQRAAELAHVAKGVFLSRMSHEMRTPLNAVIGFTQLLLSRPGTPDAGEVRDYAEHVLRAGEHLLALTNDVLDLQHVEEGRIELEAVDVPLDSLVAQVTRLLATQAEDRGVHFDNHVPDGVAVRADERRLRQVLLNIASNAVKYNRPAGVVRWSLDTGADAGRVRLSIEDTGSGLKPAQLERLFQPFERLGRETSTIEGTGLGLIIARSLTVAMGGTLRVASSAGVGTRVLLDLPMARQTALPFGRNDEAPADTAAGTPADAPTQVAPLRILYVEDNRINAILFEEAIRLRKDVELRLAEDGNDALDQVRDWTPDVLVLDAHLPGMDGFELLVALRRQPGLGRTPAFMCSADAMPDDVQRAAKAGFAGYWPKPINLARIMDDLDRIRADLSPTPAARALER